MSDIGQEARDGMAAVRAGMGHVRVPDQSPKPFCASTDHHTDLDMSVVLERLRDQLAAMTKRAEEAEAGYAPVIELFRQLADTLEELDRPETASIMRAKADLIKAALAAMKGGG